MWRSWGNSEIQYKRKGHAINEKIAHKYDRGKQCRAESGNARRSTYTVWVGAVLAAALIITETDHGPEAPPRQHAAHEKYRLVTPAPGLRGHHHPARRGGRGGSRPHAQGVIMSGRALPAEAFFAKPCRSAAVSRSMTADREPRHGLPYMTRVTRLSGVSASPDQSPIRIHHRGGRMLREAARER